MPYFNVQNSQTFHCTVVEHGATPEREPQLAEKIPDHRLCLVV
ncbi:hypothetical protein [Rheinheimera nanhaiensis]|uniref:Uncharacterized protein n=1 Tax=Rheinheimera nanhaiensis E407-8 TaxID=562729 RepID=I1E049_9GAMM|nr:hypothetical protein [Rheinheimera nanhaiensis]GAB59677.1 hypothetical protein RNAN_2683 [Rheinheimera nanhaiensis E407-8]